MAMKYIGIVDDDATTRSILEMYVSSEQELIAKLFDSGVALIEYIKENRLDLIILDIEMPGLSGIQVFDMLKDMPNAKKVPVVFLTGKEDKATILKCIGRGADGYMVKPVKKNDLLPRIHEVLDKYEDFKSDRTILMIDDDADFLKIAKIKLSKYYKVLTVNSGKTALDYLGTHTVDLIILDYFMPLYNGDVVLTMLKKRETTKDIPVILASALDEEEANRACEKNMPDKIMQKPINIDDLLENIKSIFASRFDF